MTPLLAISDLAVEFPGVRAVDGVSLSIARGETLGVVGESGSGKSVTFLATLGLIPSPPGRVTAGRATFDGVDLLRADAETLRRVRGRRIAMVFQDPLAALNPYLTVGRQIGEVLEVHLHASRRAARDRAVELLRRVRVPDPECRVDEHPHQLSGGMRQRVMIAMALACGPDLLVADEPTTALDVTIQAQVLDLLGELRGTGGMATVLITHDLGVVAGMADRVAVMYAGRVVEEGPAAELLARPRHPYTLGLLRSRPRLDGDRGRPLPSIPGAPPEPGRVPPGCPFAPRCEYVREECGVVFPAVREVSAGHRVWCHATEVGT